MNFKHMKWSVVTLIGVTMGSASAQSFNYNSRSKLTVSPILGIERVQKYSPTPHMKTRATYGVRATYQLPISSLEAEYTRSKDDERDILTDANYEETQDKLRVGLRGNFNAGRFLSYYMRGGAQGTKREITRTKAGEETTTRSTSKINPYVGTGLTLRLLNFVSVSGDVVATYTPTDDPNLKDYEIQPTVSFNLSF